jgi:quercetin dioxygenase-like cupin family protein
MSVNHKNKQWVVGDKIKSEPTSAGASRKVLAFCDEAMCVENYFEKGAQGALHSHPHTQITYVAEGRFLFTIGEERREVKKGDSLLKQNQVQHGCVCLERGVLVDFFTPHREDFVK